MIYSADQFAALAPSKDTSNPMPNSLARPADIFLPNWSHGGPAVFDVHVISLLQQQTLEEAASNLDHDIQVGVKRKLSSHLLGCCFVRIDFIPFVTETLVGQVLVIKVMKVALDKREFEEVEMAVQHKSKLRVYKELKRGVRFEEYLKHVNGPSSMLLFKFRSGTHGRFEEWGRHAMGGGGCLRNVLIVGL